MIREDSGTTASNSEIGIGAGHSDRGGGLILGPNLERSAGTQGRRECHLKGKSFGLKRVYTGLIARVGCDEDILLVVLSVPRDGPLQKRNRNAKQMGITPPPSLCVPSLSLYLLPLFG